MFDKKICPWCEKEIKDDQETVTNGGGEQTGGIFEDWHKNCFEESDEHERNNFLRI